MRRIFFQLVLLPLPLLVAAVCFAAEAIVSTEAVVISKDVPETVPEIGTETAARTLPQHLFRQLPQSLTARQQAAAMDILFAAGPRLAAVQGRVAAILEKLRALSFSAQTHADLLTELGLELVVARDALRAELGRVGDDLEKAIGLNPEWDLPRSCSMPQTVHGEAMYKN